MDMTVLSSSALAVAALMLGVWIISLVISNASIVDLAWGFGFVVVAWVSALTVDRTSETPNPVGTLLLVLATVWGLRLFVYLAWRNLGHGEDFRYVKMRKHWGPRFPIISLVTVFGLQGVLMLIVSLPLQIGIGDTGGEAIGIVAIVGTVLWSIGLTFETIGDLQLARFKADPGNEGAIMNRGLWAWTRHPNYFGDFCVWWGLGIVALQVGWTASIGLIGPLVMSVLLMKVSGKDLLERNLKRRRPGYETYMAETSGFFPRPPKRASSLRTSP